MTSRSSTDSCSDSLNGSWVDIGAQSHRLASPSLVKVAPLNSYSLEKLLRDAQRESGSSSRIDSPWSSSRQSPRSPAPSPSSEIIADNSQEDCDVVGTDWVWNWSSRPEAVPPSDVGLRMKHPASQWQKFSIRNTRVMRAIYFSIENLPFLLFTHACTFILGAATVLIYLKKYCHWSSVQLANADA